MFVVLCHVLKPHFSSFNTSHCYMLVVGAGNYSSCWLNHATFLLYTDVGWIKAYWDQRCKSPFIWDLCKKPLSNFMEPGSWKSNSLHSKLSHMSGTCGWRHSTVYCFVKVFVPKKEGKKAERRHQRSTRQPHNVDSMALRKKLSGEIINVHNSTGEEW